MSGETSKMSAAQQAKRDQTTQVFGRAEKSWRTVAPDLIGPGTVEPGTVEPGPIGPGPIESELWDADTVPIDLTPRASRKNLIAEILSRMDDQFTDVNFNAGDVILTQGLPAHGLILIREGSVEIVDRSSGHVIDVDGAGSLLGEMSLLTDRPCSADVRAKSDVKASLLTREKYQAACENFPRLEAALGQLISCRLGTHDHDALCGKTLAGYRIESCINRGGMGVIYRATDPRGTTVALKMLMHKFIEDSLMQKRFDQEAELLSSLNHPNVITLVGHFLEFRTRFLVLEFCDGCDLLEVLHQHGTLEEPDVRAIVGQIAGGLWSAHGQGIWHRDLKPANILVDKNGQIRVTDFGLSRLREIDVPDDRVVGTPAFMAPEQFVATESDAAADWYAFACLIVQLLTGDVPFKAPDVCEMYRVKTSTNPSHALRDSFSEKAISSELFGMLSRALEPEREQRKLNLEQLIQWAKPVPHLVG